MQARFAVVFMLVACHHAAVGVTPFPIGIYGCATDVDNLPIESVTAVVIGLQRGAIADSTGFFAIRDVTITHADTLLARRVGYKTAVVPLNASARSILLDSVKLAPPDVPAIGDDFGMKQETSAAARDSIERAWRAYRASLPSLRRRCSETLKRIRRAGTQADR